MTTSYPGAIDSLTNPTPSDTLNSATVPHAAQHANLNDAMEAVQTELGTTPSGPFATVKARFDDTDTKVNSLIVDMTVVQSDVAYRIKGYTSSNQPASPQAGDLWVDPDDSSVKIWNGSAFVNPSNAGGGGTTPVVASGGTETTYTGDGTNGVLGQKYKVHTFTGNGSLTVTQGGTADVMICGGGHSGGNGDGGTVWTGSTPLAAGSYTVSVGAAAQPGGVSRFGTLGANGGVSTVGAGAGQWQQGATGYQGIASRITGTLRAYGTAQGFGTATDYGNGGGTATAGVVVVRYTTA